VADHWITIGEDRVGALELVAGSGSASQFDGFNSAVSPATPLPRILETRCENKEFARSSHR
jgi:hypothetical protein